MEQGAGKEGRLEMKVTGIAGIQCAILLMVLLAALWKAIHNNAYV